MNTKNSFWLLLFTLPFILSSCADYKVAVAPGPEGEVNMSISPDETLLAEATQGEYDIDIISNMPPSTMSVAVKDTWCQAELVGNTVKLQVSENLKYIARATSVTIKVFSKTKTIEVQQKAREFVSEPIYPIEGVYRIAIPALADFDVSKIYKVMDGDQKVAEICLEYLNNGQISSRAVVVYVGKGGGASYNDGFVAYLVDADGNISGGNNNGGKVIFNTEDNTFDYLPGTGPSIAAVYLSAYGITWEEQNDAVEAAAEPYLVRDVCGNSYPVVKIGATVWLGSNLRTTKFGDDTDIPLIPMSEIVNYKNDTPFATYPTNNPAIDAATYGYLYNARTITGDNEALLEESIVDGNWRVATGGGSTAAGVNGSGTDWQRLFKYVGNDQSGALLAKGYSWNNGGDGQFDIATVSNVTGLSIPPAGEIYNITGGFFVIGGNTQAFFFWGGGNGNGYSFAERDGRALDQAGIRVWPHGTDACSIRLVRIDD